MTHSYNTPESFSRAFERFHGVLPSAAKTATLKSFSRLSIKLVLEGGSVMDYRIEDKKAFRLLAKSEEQYIGKIKISRFWKTCEKNGYLNNLKDCS